VEANTFNGNESPDGRITMLSCFCKPTVQKGGRGNTSRDEKGLARHTGRDQGARSRLRKMHGDARDLTDGLGFLQDSSTAVLVRQDSAR